MFWIIALIVLGLFLLVVEFFMIPGVTVAGIGGFLIIIYAIYSAYADHGTTAGHLTLVFTAIASVATLVFSLRARTWKRVSLETSIDSKAVDGFEDELHEGDEGVTISRLAPMGKASINGKTVEVTALGELINPNTPIVVVRVESNKIIVKPK
ncbi:MAG: NfeD family protein [Bacteroidota bacterium]